MNGPRQWLDFFSSHLAPPQSEGCSSQGWEAAKFLSAALKGAALWLAPVALHRACLALDPARAQDERRAGRFRESMVSQHDATLLKSFYEALNVADVEAVLTCAAAR